MPAIQINLTDEENAKLQKAADINGRSKRAQGKIAVIEHSETGIEANDKEDAE